MALGAQKLGPEAAGGDAQVNGTEKADAQSRVVVEFLKDRVHTRGTQAAALEECVGIRGPGEVFDLPDEWRKMLGFDRKHMVVPGDRGIGGQIGDVADIRARPGIPVVQDRGQEDHPIAGNALALKIVDQIGRPGGSVAFTQKELGRVPAVVLAHVAPDELTEGADIRIDTPEVLVFPDPDDPAVAGSHCVDENQIGYGQKTRRAVDDLVGGRRSGMRVGRHRPNSAEPAHEQPDRRGSRAAVVDKGDRALREAMHAVFGIGDVKHARRGFALLVFEDDRSCGCGVADPVPVDYDRTVAYRLPGVNRGERRRWGFGGSPREGGGESKQDRDHKKAGVLGHGRFSAG